MVQPEELPTTAPHSGPPSTWDESRQPGAYMAMAVRSIIALLLETGDDPRGGPASCFAKSLDGGRLMQEWRAWKGSSDTVYNAFGGEGKSWV